MSKKSCNPSKSVSKAGKTLGSGKSSSSAKSSAGKTLVNHKNNQH